MKKNQYATLMACTTVLLATLPGVGADAEPFDQQATASGPAGLDVKGFAGVSFVYCFQDPTFPVAPCAPNPGGVGGLGGSIIYVNDNPNSVGDWNIHPNYDPTVHVGRDVRIWIESSPGSIIAGGFGAMVCADQDDDLACTDADGAVTAWAGNGDDPCDGNDKDLKDCDSPIELEMHVCIPRDNGTGDVVTDDGTVTVTDTAFDDYYVFIRSWADTMVLDFGEPNSNGVGANLGNFDIYAEYGAFLTQDDCTLENMGDPGTPDDPSDGTRPDEDQVVTTGGGSGGGSGGWSGGGTQVGGDPPGPIPPRILVRQV